MFDYVYVFIVCPCVFFVLCYDCFLLAWPAGTILSWLRMLIHALISLSRWNRCSLRGVVMLLVFVAELEHNNTWFGLVSGNLKYDVFVKHMRQWWMWLVTIWQRNGDSCTCVAPTSRMASPWNVCEKHNNVNYTRVVTQLLVDCLIGLAATLQNRDISIDLTTIHAQLSTRTQCTGSNIIEYIVSHGIKHNITSKKQCTGHPKQMPIKQT